jgi:transcriptional regulator with XRE-family HTH domain
VPSPSEAFNPFQQAGISQKELARQLKTTQQQISRLESPGYEGHSLGMLLLVAKAQNAKVRLVLEPEGTELGSRLGASPSRAPPPSTPLGPFENTPASKQAAIINAPLHI